MEKAAIVHAVQPWEHMVLTRRSANYLVDDLNKEGQSGWELVSVLHYKDPKGIMAWTAFLKRPAAHQASAAMREQKASSARPATQPEDVRPAEPSDGFDLSGDEFAIQEEPGGGKAGGEGAG